MESILASPGLIDLKLIQVIRTRGVYFPSNGTPQVTFDNPVSGYEYVFVLADLHYIAITINGTYMQFQPFPSLVPMYRRPSFPNDIQSAFWMPRLDAASWQGPRSIRTELQFTKTSFMITGETATNYTNPAGSSIQAQIYMWGAPTNSKFYPTETDWIVSQ